jgi:hypothetical protein
MSPLGHTTRSEIVLRHYEFTLALPRVGLLHVVLTWDLPPLAVISTEVTDWATSEGSSCNGKQLLKWSSQTPPQVVHKVAAANRWHLLLATANGLKK